ncbi:MAG: NADH-quinone oxidoreductase subunit H [Lentisphaeria bacterium]|nr:NADH-quinone oxidoreductase subunit H [Lentisphaeria bacterium]MBR7120291.1 NADH-quinone oxidoreductase subunit H [Lentisphaeria bacterium]
MMTNNCFRFANIAAALLLSPLLFGIIAKVKAFFAGRKGVPLFQLYYDIFKLLRRGVIYSTSVSGVFQIAPCITLVGVVCALAILPCQEYNALISFDGDMLLFIYLLALARAFTVLAAMNTASSFAGMGSARELHFAIFSECAIMAMLGVLTLHSGGELSLSGIFSSLAVNNMNRGLASMAVLLAAIGFFLVMLAENCRVPADDPETHLELTMIHEAMILDYSGIDLGIIHYAAAVKLWVFAQFMVMMLMPSQPIWIVWIGVFIVAAAIGVVESVTARFRMLKVPHYLVGAFAIELAALALLIWETL